jgi:hypothetical protein
MPKSSLSLQKEADEAAKKQDSSKQTSDFESSHSLIKFKIEPTDELVDKYAKMMSKKDRKESMKVNLSESKVLKKTNQLNL